MSFSRLVKLELLKHRLQGETRRAQLAGLTHTAGTLRLGRRPGILYTTETHEVGLHVARLASQLYGMDATVAVRSSVNRRQMLTTVSLTGGAVEDLLQDAGLLLHGEEGLILRRVIPARVYETQSCAKAFLRGAFLGAGSCSDPQRAYHIEIVCASEELAEGLLQLLGECGCPASSARRKDRIVVYIKDGDRIAAFLTVIGAINATLSFENARVERDLRNYINRTSNCETANIGKTVYAAGEQVDAIKAIMAAGRLERLSPVLRETAELRLNNPELSLQELADMAGTGKSGMNHRLQRLIRIAEELR